ncbi:MAG: hypothetical protein ACFCVD_24305 [Nodosilinea sp.]
MLNPFKNLGQPQPEPANRQPALSPADYAKLAEAVAARAEQGASWDQIQTYLRNRSLTSEHLAQWMTAYGGQWVMAPNPQFGQRLHCLSQVAQGELAKIAAILGQAILAQTGVVPTDPAAVKTPDPTLPVVGPEGAEILEEDAPWALAGSNYRVEGSILVEENALPFVLVNPGEGQDGSG